MTPVPGRGRPEEDARRAEVALDGVRDGAADERNPDEVLLRVLDPLADGLGHLARLAQPGAHHAAAVADDDQGAEAEAAAALDDLRDAVDLDDLLLEGQLGGVNAWHVFSAL